LDPIKVVEGGATRYTLYDGQTPLLDFNGSGTVTARYLSDPRAIDAMLARETSGGTVAWYLTDRLGTVRDIVNNSGTVIDHIDYTAYGIATETSSSNGDRFKYAGMELDAVTGLDYDRARWYDPNSGRFLAQDPISFGGGDSNLYRYVGNVPTNLTDPSGLAPPPQQPGTPAPAFTPTIVSPPGWHPPMALPTVLYVYDGKDPGNPKDPFLANGASFTGAVQGRGGDLLDMSGCSNFNDFISMINYIDTYTKQRGTPYDWIVFLDHGNKVVGQSFGNYNLGTESTTPWLLQGPLGKLGQSTSNGFQFWGCLAASSPTTPLFAALTGKPVRANWKESVSLTWGPYWAGGPFKWFYPPNWIPSPVTR
jgi:RHS repeat-associated protein